MDDQKGLLTTNPLELNEQEEDKEKNSNTTQDSGKGSYSDESEESETKSNNLGDSNFLRRSFNRFWVKWTHFWNRTIDKEVTQTRNDLQLGRRLFHFSTGFTVATVYNLYLGHHQVVYILGTVACILYFLEQIRLAYPEFSNKFNVIGTFFLRAEEQLKESAAIPYAMAILLIILSFPKTVSLIAIYTLAVADPLSAIVGITIGKHKIIKGKSVEGSLAFFVGSIMSSMGVLLYMHPDQHYLVFKCSFIIAVIVTLLEIIPIRVDDNFTIPLFTAFVSWGTLIFFGI